MNWKRILCWLTGHRWSERVDLGTVTISGGTLNVHYMRDDHMDSKVLRLHEQNNIMIWLRVCCRCHKIEIVNETNLPIVEEAT
jgi:hypothetical protein